MVGKTKKEELSGDLKEKLRGSKLLALDFDGVLTDNKVIVNEEGGESVVCSREDGLGIELLNAFTEIETIVLSKETNPVVAKRCQKLHINYVQGVEDKIEKLKEESRNRGISLEQVIFVGNDVNDLDCIKYVGIGICVADALPPLKRFSKLVTSKRGGCGAVREVCELILRERSLLKW